MRPTRPKHPPPVLTPDITTAERTAITAALGELPDDLLRPLRDARGARFQRLEFYGDGVLELVLSLHVAAVGHHCAGCRDGADALVTDDALADAARRAGLDAWLEWEASDDRRADLLEACCGAVHLANGWHALASLVDRVVHPLAPLTPDHVVHGRPGVAVAPNGRTHEVLGASVLEVAAAGAAYRDELADPHELTRERNRRYATSRVVSRARAVGMLPAEEQRRTPDKLLRDDVERRLAVTALEHGVAAAVAQAAPLVD